VGLGVLVAVGPASPFWHGACPGPDLDPDPSRQRRCPDCCPYALLTGDPPEPRGKRFCLCHQPQRLPPETQTQMSALFLGSSAVDQLFDRGSARHGSEKGCRGAATRRGFQQSQFWLERVKARKAGPFLDPQRALLLRKHSPLSLSRGLGQIGSEQVSPAEVRSLSSCAEVSVKRQRASSSGAKQRPPAGLRPQRRVFQ